tara:strand:- start:137 stop:706 length:570 start_codon:yes stop_codon:yes gene_type:complete
MFSFVMPSKLIVITGPSGVGKGTLVERLIKKREDIWLSVSATTRKPRFNEESGKHYYFLTVKQFIELRREGGLLEWAEFAGNFYGTPKEKVLETLNSGKSVLLEIELEGARQIRSNFPEAIHIFLSPPSFEELERRIRGRATESEDSIERRLKKARLEVDYKDEFDTTIVNHDIEDSIMQIEKFLMNYD